MDSLEEKIILETLLGLDNAITGIQRTISFEMTKLGDIVDTQRALIARLRTERIH